MKIGLLLIATRGYQKFVLPLLDDVENFFFKGEEVNVYLFTDILRDDLPSYVQQIKIESYGFPEASLYRFRMFHENQQRFHDDYLFFLDVDLTVVGPVGREILEDGLVAVEHARCWSAAGTWETRPESTAFVPPEFRNVYYAGGVFGGEKRAFLAMCAQLERAIKKDEENGIMAVWHDESHLNCYFASSPPKVLSPEYCFPPNPAPELALFTQPKIVALMKDHKDVRRAV